MAGLCVSAVLTATSCAQPQPALSVAEIDALLEEVYAQDRLLDEQRAADFGYQAVAHSRLRTNSLEMRLDALRAALDTASLSPATAAVRVRHQVHGRVLELLEDEGTDPANQTQLFAFLWDNYRRPRSWMSLERRRAESAELRSWVAARLATTNSSAWQPALSYLAVEQHMAIVRDSSLGELDAELRDQVLGLIGQIQAQWSTRQPPGKDSTYETLIQGLAYEVEHLSVGQPIPELVAEDLDGVLLSLANYRGKVVLLSGWATWCAPCRAIFPSELALAEELSEAPFAILGVNDDEDREHARAVARKEGLTWPSLYSYGAEPTVTSILNMNGLPAFFVVDGDGVIVARAISGGDATVQWIHDSVHHAVQQVAELDGASGG